MASGKLCLLTLCTLVVLSQLIVPAESWSCCLKYTKRPLSCKRLLAYSYQYINQNCDIHAVIFHLANGRFVCADPLARWTQRGINCVNSRRQKEDTVLKEDETKAEASS